MIICATFSAVALAGSVYTPVVAGFVLICLCAFAIFGFQPVFWTLPIGLYKGKSLAAGVAIVNTAGALGGFLGPYVVGLIRDATGSFSAALLTLAASSIAIAATIAAMRLPRIPEAD